MAQKSRELDSQLKELLIPIGFKKVPKTRYFIRMCGDGVIQGASWDYEPICNAQILMIWINSIFSDPDHLFREYLSWRLAAIMRSPSDCFNYIYKENEYIPTRRFGDFSEEEQLNHFREQVLPRLERWQTQKDVFRARQGKEMASAEGYPLCSPHYNVGRDFNLSFYLGLRDEAEKYLDEPIFFEQHLESVSREQGYEKQAERCRKDKEKWIRRKAFIKGDDPQSSNDETVRLYLQLCKEQNLYDYERILKGDRGIMTWEHEAAPEMTLPFFDLIQNNKSVPIQW